MHTPGSRQPPIINAESQHHFPVQEDIGVSGEKDQVRLQQMMAPDLRPETYVYCTFQDHRLPAYLSPICTFRETEGLTAIVERAQAIEAKVPFIFEAKLITLTVHSSLEAIGFLAMIATALAKAGIPCNAVAAFHHDHLFIPVERADDAFSLLDALSHSGAPA